MKNTFEAFLFEKLEVHPSSKVLLAISGGMDSMCLWHLSRRCKLNYAIAHCNFQLRGRHSEADEEFVKTFARNDEQLFVKSFDTKAYAKNEGLSTQMAARKLRYDFFDKVMLKEHFDYLFTAHHLDDQIETFFVQLLRKSNLPALAGIPMRAGKIVRPLMFADREEIENYIVEHEVLFREDESNANVAYLRNSVRHNLMPALGKVKPDFRSMILEIMGNVREVSDSLHSYYLDKKEKLLHPSNDESVTISIEEIKSLDLPLYFLESLLLEYGFNKALAKSVFKALDGQSGKCFYSKEYRLIKDRKHLIISTLIIDKEEIVEIEKDALIESSDYFVHAEKLNNQNNLISLYSERVALLDYDKVEDKLCFRKWRKGDHFYPLGLGGKKKLSDFFTDKKFSLEQKDRQWVLLSGKNICWVVGQAIDDRFKIGENTKHVLLLETQ